MKKILGFSFLLLLFACKEGQIVNTPSTLAPGSPLNPDSTPTPLPSGTVTPTPTPTVDPGSDPSKETHTYGVPRQTAHASNGKLIPITLIFLKSSTQTLTNDPVAEGNKAIAKMNERFTMMGLSLVKFTLKEALVKEDNTYFNASCNQLSSVASKYGTGNSMVMVVVNDLAGSCAGVSFLWKFPKDKSAVTMCEFTPPFKNGTWTPLVHEFAHSFGLNHTGDEYAGSVPTTGLNSFNSLLFNPGGRTCNSALMYFIDPVKRHNGAVANGVTFDSYYNTMYPSYGGQPDNGFFTKGYDYSMSWAFDCWYQFAQSDI